ncbi:MAG: hypothetical protein ACRENE_18135 [Polyangiaceae bacterium]
MLDDVKGVLPYVELQEGYVGFDVPGHMTQGKSAEVKVTVSNSEAIIKQTFAAASTPPTVLPQGLSPEMSVDLDGGEDFDITPKAGGKQVVQFDRPTTWRFTVLPKGHGPTHLALYVHSWVNLPGYPLDAPVDAYTRRDIAVEINVPYLVAGFVTRNWQWLFGALLVPIVGLIANKLRRPAPLGAGRDDD